MIVGIYKVFKQEMQSAIKKIAQKHGITPLMVMTTKDEEVLQECILETVRIEDQIVSDFEIAREDVYAFSRMFYYETEEYISPGFIDISDDSITSHINRILTNQGYQAVNPNAIQLIIKESCLLSKEGETL